MSNWNRQHRRQAQRIAESVLRGVGERSKHHIQFGEYALHYRRPMTNAEAAALPVHPDRVAAALRGEMRA